MMELLALSTTLSHCPGACSLLRPISVRKSDAEIIERPHRVSASGVTRIAPVVEGPMGDVAMIARVRAAVFRADDTGRKRR